MGTIPNVHHPKWHYPEWTLSHMDTISNEQVFHRYCLVTTLLQRREFKKKLIISVNLSDL